MNYTTKYQDYPKSNREYKDTLFRLVFSRKKDLLALYNAINDTNYQNPDDLEINTLENAIYLSMKNDVSFLLGCTMNLYEHQSTYNPNMPLRGIFYFARLYEKFITSHKINIYSRTLQKIPSPRYIVFYNGTRLEPDKTVLRLSDAFQKDSGCLECEVTMLNINYGRNQELMEKCRRLEEYTVFIDRVKTLLAQNNNQREHALNLAIDECIHNNILKDVLITQRAEVLGMILSTFDKELYEQGLKDDAYNEGEAAGYKKKLAELIQKKLAKGKSIETIADELEESVENIQKIVEDLTEK